MTYMTMAWNCTFAHSLHEIRRLIQKIKKTSFTKQIIVSKTRTEGLVPHVVNGAKSGLE